MTARSMRLLIICSVLLLTMMNAQTTGKISGTVIDQDTREPLIGCNVILLGTTLGASCDLDGTFFILNIPLGKYDLQVSLLGYQRRIQQGVIVNSGRTTVADFALKATVVEQDAVVVQATRPDVEPEKTSTSTIIRPEEVQQIAGMRDVSDVIGLAADVTDGHFRGGRSGEELYTLQGMGIVNPLDASSAFVPIMSAVEEVEVITSGFGAQYGNAQSGVVNISMKEGKSDRWHSTFETRMRMPQRKHFGPSVFDPKENYYLSKLLDPAIWRNGDIETGLPYYTSFGNSKNGYANDTLVQVQVAMAMWRLQMHRDLYLNYGNELDYSIEGGTGGPISESARMFLAIRSNVSHPVFPTEQPDLQRQVMGNVAADLGEGMTLRISGGIAENNTNIFPSSNSLGYYNWLWDRIMSIQYQRSLNSQAGLRFSKALSSSTFYEFKANALSTSTQFGSMPWQSSIPDSMFGVTKLNSASSLTTLLAGPDKFYYLRGTDDFRNEKTLTVSVEGSVTSQVTKDHMLNGGIQFNQYFIDAKGFFNTSVAATLQTRSYTAEPRELGIYLQDKMEFEGMIANVGLRLDVWDANKDYFVNLYNPFGVADSAGVVVNNFAMAARSKPPIIGRLQPRAGISFPIDVTTVFHLNYGSFMQRPSFQYIVATTLEYGANKTVQPISLGNPRLQPQVTNSYDVGVTKGLGEGFTLDISGYYKDVKDLIEQAFFYDQRSNVSYSTYFNRDYADIRGFRVALSKRRGMVSGSINYQFGVATGKSATVSNAPPSFTLDTLGQIRTETQNVPTRDIILDFDRTHNVVVTAAFRTEEDWGPSVADIYPFGNVSLSSNSFMRSGRPYTPTANTKLTNSARTPAEYNTNLKITKKVTEFFGTTATFYCEVFNLFEDRILNYSYLFPKVNAGSTNDVTKAYENYPINDRNVGVLYWNDTNDKSGFPVDQSFLIYDNTPRSITFGMTLEF